MLSRAWTRPSRGRRGGAVLFDRDGVLNDDAGYVHRPERFVWMPGAIEAIRRVNASGRRAIVVTNQSGIARGYYSKADFWALMDWVQDSLWRHGARLDAVYACPHHPTEGRGALWRACRCRKPGPGMLERALEQWDLEAEHCVLVGDRASDLAAAAAVGMPAVRHEGGDLRPTVETAMERATTRAVATTPWEAGAADGRRSQIVEVVGCP